MKKRAALLFVMATFLVSTLHAQWGIRYVLPQTEAVTKAGPFDLWLIGLGFDFDLSDRTSCGVDLMIDTNWDPYGKSRETATSGSTYGTDYYYEKLKVYGIQYRSQYHFSDNDGTSVYLGSFFGLRYVRQTVTGDIITGSSQYSYSTTEFIDKGSGVIFPVGLRLGVRGGLDAGFADLYVGVGYALGSGDALTKAPYLTEESELSPLNLQIGLAIGFGH